MGHPVIIRADAGPAIGIGHLMRCLALAEELEPRGYRVTLVTKGEHPALDYATLAGVSRVEVLPQEVGIEAELSRLASLVRTMGAEAIVLDGYAFDRAYQQRLRPLGPTLLCVDDLAAGPFDCDLVLNQNLGPGPGDYAGLITPETRLLLGPAYALLRRAFRERAGRFQLREAARNILVTVGGADYQDVAVRVIRELATLSNITVDLVLGPAYRHPDPLARCGVAIPIEIRVYRSVTRMDLLMEQADLAISAAGSTVWELACLGVPMLLISTKDGQGNNNQERLGRVMADRGATVTLGMADDLGAGVIARTASALLGDADRRRGLSRAAAALVDGWGASRVADQIETLGPCRQGVRHEPD